MTKFVKSNEAVVMGALYAGCDLYFGYPITPASEIAHGAAKWFPMLGRTFVQAECETASVNMMFGAAGAGKLCMTATSGPGFSLMQEGLSYLAGAELPAVVVDVNRAGPGLGNVYPGIGLAAWTYPGADAAKLAEMQDAVRAAGCAGSTIYVLDDDRAEFIEKWW